MRGREAALAELAQQGEVLSARIAELDAALSDAELARQQALADLAALDETTAARIAELDAALSDAELARQQALADLAALDETTAARIAELDGELDDAERVRLSEVAAAEALRARLAEVEADLSDEEQARIAELAAAEALRERLRGSDAELTAMTLALENQRRRAEETLTLLAAANRARERAESQAEESLTDAEGRAVLLAIASDQLAEAEALASQDQRRLAVLNTQVQELRQQVTGLQDLLGDTRQREADARTQVETLGADLNAALARVAFEQTRLAEEQRRRAELEEAERRRLEEETRQLERYRSEFFGQMSTILAGREGVRIVGDRFVFSSEVLFEPGSADLAAEGRAQIANVVSILSEVARDIPPEIDWILRVDGHTDNTPIPAGAAGPFANNWELSQGRALSVVLYMIETLGFPPERLAATGFGEYRPVSSGATPEGRAQNRRIELKLTER
ncbi:MAG TPA: peptidoglycan -binding protein [Paracoccus sp.]|nr:peptidoglycan -binding protein [Paracoccus sp. (in: a-proteobacteria)]